MLKEADALELSKRARMRLQWILHTLKHDGNVSLTCRHFDISRTTLYKCLTRFNPEDPRSLEDQSTAPKRVPQEQTDARVIALVEQYRKEETQLSKDKIRERLSSEHGVNLSASTIGRIISRHGFYFADTLSHQEKRRSVLDPEGNGEWKTAAVLVAGTAVAINFVDVQSAHALEGSAYQIIDESNQTAAGSLEGSTFTVRNGGMTDTAQPLQGSVYNITIPVEADASSSAASSQISSQAEIAEETSTDGGGGRRGSEAIPSPAPSSAAASEADVSSTSSASSISEQSVSSSISADEVLSEQIPEDASSIAEEERVPSEDFETFPSFNPEEFTLHPSAPETVHSAAATSTSLLPAAIISIAILAVVAGNAIAPFIATTVAALPYGWARAFIRSILRTTIMCLLAVTLLIAILWGVARANAATTVPANHWYQGQLLDSAGEPVTIAVTIRLSYWKSADFTASDLTGAGAIETAATNYGGWYEEHTLTPGDGGAFAIEVGSVQALPDFSTLPQSTLTSLFLQVEVKTSGAADTTYDLLDSNPGNTAVDRTSVLSLPFAKNADLLDQRDVGTGSGSIPLLTTGASFGIGGNMGINNDNEAANAILTFGNNILAETLQFAATNGRFEFSDDVHVAGQLTVSGGLIVSRGVTVSGSTVIRGSLSGSSIGGFNLTDCQGSANKLTYNASLQRFECGSDTDTDTNTTYTAGQGLSLNGTSLSLSSSFSGSSLEVSGTASGEHLHFGRLLTGSGTVKIQTLVDSITAFQIFDADGGNPVFSVDTVNERVGIGTSSPTALLTLSGSNTEMRLSAGDYARVVRSSGSNTLTWYNRVLTPAATVGSALSFNESDYVTVTDTAALRPGTSAFSLSVWANGSNSSVFQKIVSKQSGSTYDGWSLVQGGNWWTGATGKKACIGIGSSSLADVRAYCTVSDIFDGNWHHIIVTSDGSSITIYADGTSQSLTTDQSSGSWPNLNQTDALIIGNGPAFNQTFTGLVDELRIYSRALSASDVTTIYNNGSGQYGTLPDSGLVAGWHFDENTGSLAADYSDNGNTGTLMNSPTWTAGTVSSGTDGISEASVWSSQDGVDSSEEGIQTFGWEAGRTNIDYGTSLRFIQGTSDTEVGRWDSSGNFGIGTTSPKAKLDVVGTMSGSSLTITGKASSNKVLCVKSTGAVGICSSDVDSNGGCTCN